MTREQLHTGLMICRSCHSAIHSFIDNKTLAAEFNTLEKLLTHEKVQGWIPYIRKKRPISRGDRRTLLPNERRDMPPSDDDDDEWHVNYRSFVAIEIQETFFHPLTKKDDEWSDPKSFIVLRTLSRRLLYNDVCLISRGMHVHLSITWSLR